MPELHIQHTGEQLITTFGEHRSTALWADIASWTPQQVSKDVEAYGRTLFEQITHDEGLRTSLMGLHKNERLILVAEQREVAAVPWEYMRFPSDSQLGDLLLATRYNLVRGIAEENRRESVMPELPLTIVAIPVSAVDELHVLNTEREWRNLGEMVKKRNHSLTLTRVRPPTLTAMGRALSGEGTNIVQFMGHSGIVNGKGVLAFEDDLGWKKNANAVLFANSLNEQTFLVVLNSCYSAVASRGSSDVQNGAGAISQLSNIAQAVVREGVPYALGMQFSLLDSAALEITDVLYESLLQGRGVEEAVRLMRVDLEQKTMLPNAHWLAGVPVLYTNLRTPAPALKLDTAQPVIVPDPQALTESSDLSALSPAEHFVGRSEQISEALSVLLNASARGFVVLQGFGGIGKTALARVIAERVSWHYQDRVLAYSFETFARFDYENAEIPTTIDTQFAERFYSRLASFYGLDPRQYTETRNLQNAILQRRTYTRSLLVLDNIETLIYAQKSGNADALALARFISRLKEGDSPILLTTREMPPSDWGRRKEIHLTGLRDAVGAELFLSSIATDRRRATTEETRVALSHYVQGHPLCIRLLAGRFSDDSATDLATFLKNIQDELVNARQATPSSPDDPRRHATISDCINYSIRRLTSEQAPVLYTLGIFHAPFTLAFAESVLDDEEQTEKHLQDLIRLGLLERTHVVLADGQFDVYELHPMLRLHINLNTDTLDAETRKRYSLVFAKLARQAWQPEDGYEQSASMRYLLLQSLPDCEATLEEKSIEPTTRSTLAYHLAPLYERMGRIQRALWLYEVSLKVYQDLEDVRGIALTQNEMANLLVQQGQVKEAMKLYEVSLKTKQELGDVREVAVTQAKIADLLAQQGKIQEAVNLYEQVLKAFQEVGNVRDVAVAQSAIANLLTQQGQVTEAMRLYEVSLKTKQELGDVREIAATQYAIASLLRQQGQVTEAMRLYEVSLKTSQELGDVQGIAATQGMIAILLKQQGRVQEAISLYQQSLRSLQELGDVRNVAVMQTNLGNLLWQQGEYVQALTQVWSAYKSLPESDFPRDVQSIRSFLISFKQQFSGEEQQFDALWLQATTEPQPDWLLIVQAGSSMKDDATEEAQEPSEEFQAIVGFVNAESWDATQRVVEAQQEVLFRLETERVFEQLIEQATISGKQRTVEMLETHLAILRACKTDGIEATFVRIKSMQEGQNEM